LALLQGHKKSKEGIYNHLDNNIELGLFKCPVNRQSLRRYEDNNTNGSREIACVHHYKAIVSDNNVLLTCGNQGQIYYTKKQDRAWLIRDCKPLADYFYDLISCTYDHAYTMTKEGQVIPSRLVPDSEVYPDRFI